MAQHEWLQAEHRGVRAELAWHSTETEALTETRAYLIAAGRYTQTPSFLKDQRDWQRSTALVADSAIEAYLTLTVNRFKKLLLLSSTSRNVTLSLPCLVSKQMRKSTSGRVVIDIAPDEKRVIYESLKARGGLTMREWFKQKAIEDDLLPKPPPKEINGKESK